MSFKVDNNVIYNNMKIEKNAFVVLTYELRTDGEDGAIVEKVDESNALKFVFGSGLMIPMFEAKIEGLAEGEEFRFDIPCEDAYGEVDPQAMVDIPKNIFVINGELRDDLIQVGNRVPMMGHGGQRLEGLVLEVTDDTVKMDFNHPLAGEDLFFSGKIIEVREATAEELVGPSCGGGCGGCEGGCGDHDCGCGDHDDDCGCGCGHCH